MSTRLATGGHLIDRTRKIRIQWNGVQITGHPGDTLASALLANDKTLVGRSFKYHRPRGIIASGAEEPNALVGLGTGSRFEPNQRATTTEIFDGLEARSQNHWPSLAFDIGAVNTWLAPLFSAGFYYKTFIHPRAAWKHLFEPVIRQSAGLGPAPTEADADEYEYYYHHVDVLIAGGGVAGLLAARAAATAGAQVLLCEQSPHLGGRLLVDDAEIDGVPSGDWLRALIADLEALPNLAIRTRMQVASVNDHGYLLAHERLSDHCPGQAGPRHRLWRIRAKRLVTATGAIERPIPFAANDLPGVMLASAVRDYVALYGVSPGDRTVVVTNNDDAYRTALTLRQAGLEVPAIIDTRPSVESPLARAAGAAGIRIETGKAVAEARGAGKVRSAFVTHHAGEGSAGEEIPCDCIAVSGGWSPVVHLWSHAGGKLNWNEPAAHFAPDPAKPPTGADGAGFVLAAGAASGALHTDACLESAVIAGRRAADEAGHRPSEEAASPKTNAPAEAPLMATWQMPQGARQSLRAKAFLDFQNDVKLSDVALAAREGYESVEHTKRYTTLGMATDQGKTSNINGLATLAAALGKPIEAVGTTTFRPPYTPLTFGAVAGEARGPLFKPTRKTPIDGWLDAHGAVWEPVADWRRPYAIARPGESTKAAVTREILNTRQNVGLLDASTLGKILVKGPDAARFLDLLYTNTMSTLKQGRCRYGLMCTEHGFLFDDGVVLRLDEETFLCHTTSGGADRVHGWMEEWLQTEWWDFKAYTANLTEQFAQLAVVGPMARQVLEKLTSTNISAAALPFMGFLDTELAGIKARLMRISFSGELSYEIAVPASEGMALWEALLEAGRADGIQPYGTEALHVMRAEKGFIMIGDETDGTVTPQDLGLHWAVSKKKEDFIGKRAQARADLIRPDRKQLVGLRTVDRSFVLPDGAHAIDGALSPDGTARTIGHVTSTYFSPTLGHSIAMALIERGAERMGERLCFPLEDGKTMYAEICDPVFLDPEGERQNV